MDSGLTSSEDDPWSLFERLAIVGKGGFGIAILCRRRLDRKLVVVKEIDLNTMSAMERKSAVKEADLLSILNHPNIVSYFGSYTIEGTLLIEMEFCSGGSLSSFLSRMRDTGIQPLLEEDILVLFRQIMCALTYLDDKNILHRDLKTGNIFMTDQSVGCTVKVGDFGIAKVLTTERQNASTVIGTPDMFSPEVCAGKRYTKKSEIWSAGCILYEMTCLHKTWEGPSLPVIINKIVRGSFAPIRGTYSQGLRKLIRELLEKDPDLRPRAAEVVFSVDHLLTDCNIRRLRPGINVSMLGSETLFAEQVLTSMNRRLSKRSLIFQLKVSPMVHLESSLPIPPLHVSHICRSETHTLILTTDCYVLSGCTSPIVPRPIKRVASLVGKNIVKICAGRNFSFFLNDRGLLLTSGDPKTACLGKIEGRDGVCEYVHDPEVVDSLLGVDVVDIDCAPDHVIVVSREGHAYAWGHNRNGCLGVGDLCVSPILLPTPVIFPENVSIRRVFCGKSSTAFVDSKDNLWVCGSNSCRRLGVNSPDDLYMPKKLPWIKDMGSILSVSLGEYSSAIVFSDGGFLIMGRRFGLPAFSSFNPLARLMPSFFPTKSYLDSAVIQVCCGSQSFVLLTQDSQVYFWGHRQKRRSEINLLSRAKSFVQETLKKEDIIIGENDEPLMKVVKSAGSDHPVLLIKEPKVQINDFKDIQKLCSTEEVITSPNLIMALYSSQVHLKYGETVCIKQLVPFGDEGIFLIIETNVQRSDAQRTRYYSDDELQSRTTNAEHFPKTLIRKPPPFLKNDSFSSFPDWVLKEARQSNGETKENTDVKKQDETDRDIQREELIEQIQGLKRQNFELQGEVSRLRHKKRYTNKLLLCC